jgi:hypothetical protein
MIKERKSSLKSMVEKEAMKSAFGNLTEEIHSA